ncbi:MAG: phosphatidylserine decarboxylase, partial [Halobacteria archaeon]|nr:phosphatidylserine decarboxylase [Halobacteria archaeon]
AGAYPLVGRRALLLLLLPAFVALFFRDPDREPESDGVLSPADGRVTVLEEEDEHANDRVRLGVFMGPRNVHVNRSPVDGRVAESRHVDGGHLPAFTKSSERNERRITRIDSDGDEHEVVQIAGTVARRVIPYVEEGDGVERGERIGMIAFGSRVDIVLPEEYGFDDLLVSKGDKVRAGETVVARRTDQ